jgi:hypothetical protein
MRPSPASAAARRCVPPGEARRDRLPVPPPHGRAAPRARGILPRHRCRRPSCGRTGRSTAAPGGFPFRAVANWMTSGEQHRRPVGGHRALCHPRRNSPVAILRVLLRRGDLRPDSAAALRTSGRIAAVGRACWHLPSLPRTLGRPRYWRQARKFAYSPSALERVSSESVSTAMPAGFGISASPKNFL